MSVLTKDVWDVSEQDFPSTSPIETQLGFLLRYAILAPSAKNSQPWGFRRPAEPDPHPGGYAAAAS